MKSILEDKIIKRRLDRERKSYIDQDIPDIILYKWYRDGSVKRQSLKHENLMNDKEYRTYLKLLKQQDDNSLFIRMNLKTRKRFHGLLHALMKISLRLAGNRIYSLNRDINPPENRRVIYTITHVGHDDVSVANEVIKQHFTVLLGDYENMHVGIEGIILALNGVICFDMRSKSDRSKVIPNIVECMRSGDNILCSMEAAWNISPNIPVYELFSGMIYAALEADAVIIPIAIERFKRNLWGVNAYSGYFDPKDFMEKYEDEEYAIKAAKNELRLLMADLKLQLYYHPKINKCIRTSRNTIGDYQKYKSWFEQDVLDGWFSVEDIEEKRYKKHCWCMIGDSDEKIIL